MVSHFEHLHSQYLKLSFLAQSIGAFFLCRSHPLAWVRCTPSSPSPHLAVRGPQPAWSHSISKLFSVSLDLLFSYFHLNSKDVEKLCLCPGAQLAFHSWCPPFRCWLLSISSEVLPVPWRLLSGCLLGAIFFFSSCLGAQTLKQLYVLKTKACLLILLTCAWRITKRCSVHPLRGVLQLPVLRSCRPALLAQLLTHRSDFSVQFVFQLQGESFCSGFSLWGWSERLFGPC